MKKIKLTKTLKKKWIKALRSGEYRQGVDKLCFKGEYCCLGVLADITGTLSTKNRFNGDDGILVCESGSQESAVEGLSFFQQRVLANKNDLGTDFNKIAGYIEETVHV